MNSSKNGARQPVSGPQEVLAAGANTLNGSPWRTVLLDLLLIFLLWAFAVWIVNPRGDFPLNDDWAMGDTVKRLVETGTYRPSGWAAMPMITQVLWGAAFCLPHGFSFTALRFSTLTMSAFGIAGVYLLIRVLKGSRLLCLLGALSLAFNPVFFPLSHTFMTDIPFAALLTWSAVFFLRCFQTGSMWDLGLATAFATAATLCRQLGLCLPIAFATVFFQYNGLNRKTVVRGMLPVLAGIGALAALQFWLSSSGQLPLNYNEKSDKLLSLLADPLRVAIGFVYYGWSMLMYLGLFLLPLSVMVFLSPAYRARYAHHRRLQLAAASAFALASAVRWMLVPSLMPVHTNIIIPQGIGPAILRDSLVRTLPNLPPLPAGFWLAVTILSFLGAILLVAHGVALVADIVPRHQQACDKKDLLAAHFLLLAGIVYLCPLLVIGFFDRYLIPVTCFGMGLIVLACEIPTLSPVRFHYIASASIIAGLALFGVAGTRDYLEWNRTRWKALDDLMTTAKISPDKIDGGFEFNGWYKFDSFTMTNWWKIDDTYALAFGELNGFSVMRSYPYRNWLPPREGRILVLRRNEGAGPADGAAPGPQGGPQL